MTSNWFGMFYTFCPEIARQGEERDFSLRKPTISQEVKWEEKASACFVRNDGRAVRGFDGVTAPD
jgi:hypothetical protein